MSMFDTVRSEDYHCPVCDNVVLYDNDVQFKPDLGDYYPDLRRFRVGDTLPDYPKAPLHDEWGTGGPCPHCNEYTRWVVGIDKGVIVYCEPQREGYVWKTLPAKRGPERIRRIQAAKDEYYRRNFDPVTMADIIGAGVFGMMTQVSFASMIFPPNGPNTIGPYTRRDGTWVRYRDMYGHYVSLPVAPREPLKLSEEMDHMRSKVFAAMGVSKLGLGLEKERKPQPKE